MNIIENIFKASWPFLVIILIIIILIVIFDIHFPQIQEKKDLSVYQRKPFLFDTVSELNLYKVLLELFGNNYHIFTQVNYSHLIQPRKTNWAEERRLRSSIDRKSADFVICDKEHVIPQLIIELDGSSHSLPKKQKRDEFINELTRMVDLPILHLKNFNLDKEFIKSEINNKLHKA